MRVLATSRPGPTSIELKRLDKEIESHPIWTELHGPVTAYIAAFGTGGGAVVAAHLICG